MEHAFVKRSVTSWTAKKMIVAAESKATELGLGISITIVDESGTIKAFSRMNNSPPITIDASRKKAITAVGYGMSTGESWHNHIKDDPILLIGAQEFTDFMLLGGGMPVKLEGMVIGAIGVSGGHYKQDELCCLAALESLNSK